MTRLSAMPSPNRTNFEGLYQIPRGGSAFDAAPRRRARDADPDELMGAMSSLQAHLKSKLTGDDFGTANTLLAKVIDILAPQDPDDDNGADPDDPGAEDRRRKMAGDGFSGFRRSGPSLAKRFADVPVPLQLGPRRRP
jgi:hypothetical protein